MGLGFPAGWTPVLDLLAVAFFAFFAFRRSLWEELGGWDENFLFHGADTSNHWFGCNAIGHLGGALRPLKPTASGTEESSAPTELRALRPQRARRDFDFCRLHGYLFCRLALLADSLVAHVPAFL